MTKLTLAAVIRNKLGEDANASYWGNIAVNNFGERLTKYFNEKRNRYEIPEDAVIISEIYKIVDTLQEKLMPEGALTLKDVIEHLIKQKIENAVKIKPENLKGLDIVEPSKEPYVMPEKLETAIKKEYFKFVPVMKAVKELDIYLYEFNVLFKEIPGNRIFWFGIPDHSQDNANGHILKGYISQVRKILQKRKHKSKRSWN